MGRLTPKLVTCVREGYSRSLLLGDLGAAFTVAVIAVPLAMALGIASIPAHVAVELQAIHPWLSPPAMGLFTVVVAGVLISTLGGSRVQIGGPTAAFIPIVFLIADEHGYLGLSLATLMAGIIIILMGLCRFGAMIKFIPYPVTTGFTAGIAVTILTSQVRGFLGISAPDGSVLSLPASFVPKVQELAAHAQYVDVSTIIVGVGSLATLIIMRRFIPRVPGAIVAVALSTLAVGVLGLDQAQGGPVATIGSRFGSLPQMLPAPHLPIRSAGFSWDLVRELLFPATTIAILASIESLLSAVVADGMTGFRHKSDCELVALGAANIGSAMFFGLPATGAIARTVANIKSGGRTPVAGILHAVLVLVFMLALASLASRVPLASLSAILLIVAWDISEIGHFRSLLRAPKSDVLVLLSTFGLTVLADLTIAVGVGMVLASMLFMKRMAQVADIAEVMREDTNDNDNANSDPDAISHKSVPAGVEVYEINGPFFFGIADRLQDTLRKLERPPRVYILRMRRVPAIDATGLHALDEFLAKCRRQGTILLLSGVHAQPMMAFTRSGFDQTVGVDNMFGTIDEALGQARNIVAAE